MTPPTLTDVLGAVDQASRLLPGFEVVVAELPPHVSAVAADGRVYLAAGLPAESAARYLVAAVAYLLRRDRVRHLRAVPSPRRRRTGSDVASSAGAGA